MNRLVQRIAVCCLAICVSSNGTRAQDDLDSLVKSIQPSVVLLTSSDKDGRVLIRGLGCFVSETGLILTRRSLLPASSRTEVTTADGTTLKVTGIVDENKEADIATVAVDLSQQKVKPLRVSRTNPEIDQKVVVFVSARDAIEGRIISVKDRLGGKIIQIAGRISEEPDGGPVVNMKGELLGIARSREQGKDSVFATAGENILKLANPVIQHPKLLNNPEPAYTIQARQNGVEGSVLMRVLIGTDGLVKQAKVLRGLPDGLDDQAINAAYKMKFKPATRNGQPVQFWQTVIVEFHLRR